VKKESAQTDKAKVAQKTLQMGRESPNTPLATRC